MDIQNFERLEILSLRDNDLVAIPEEIEKLTKIHELHLQVRIEDKTSLIDSRETFCI